MIYRACKSLNGMPETEVVITGEVTEIVNNKTVKIKTAAGEIITVTMMQKDYNTTVSVKNLIRVYGVPTQTNSKKGYSISGHHIEYTNTLDLYSDYYVPQGGFYKDSDSKRKSISSGNISYLIPSSWENARVSEKDREKLFNLKDASEGDCYMLNSLSGKDKAECFMIFNVDYETFIYENERHQLQGIQKAIMFNICPEYFGAVKRNFINTHDAVAHFNDPHSYYRANKPEKVYDVEFVFIERADKSGMLVMMYIYDTEAEHIDDVLYVIRSLDPVK